MVGSGLPTPWDSAVSFVAVHGGAAQQNGAKREAAVSEACHWVMQEYAASPSRGRGCCDGMEAVDVELRAGRGSEPLAFGSGRVCPPRTRWFRRAPSPLKLANKH